MLNDTKNINALASGDTYLDFIPMLKKNSSLLIDSTYGETSSVDSLIKIEPGYCIQENFRFQGTPRPFTLQSESWITLFLFFQFFIYAYVFVRSGKFWAESIKELFQVKERSSLFVDSSMKDPRQNLSLSFLSGINLGLFLYIFISSKFIYFDDKSTTIFLFMAVVVFFFILKFLSYHFLGFVFFGRNSTVSSFKNSLFTMLSLLGFVLYFINIFLIYAPDQIKIFLFFLGFLSYLLFVFFKAYRLLNFFYVEIYSFFYLILYLCTLEILPVILLYITLVQIEQIV